MGDPEIARMKVQDIPDIRVEVLNALHPIGAEEAERVNTLVTSLLPEE